MQCCGNPHRRVTGTGYFRLLFPLLSYQRCFVSLIPFSCNSYTAVPHFQTTAYRILSHKRAMSQSIRVVRKLQFPNKFLLKTQTFVPIRRPLRDYSNTQRGVFQYAIMVTSKSRTSPVTSSPMPHPLRVCSNLLPKRLR